jgi:hypothetical protein
MSGRCDDRAEEALRRQSQMEGDRSVWEGHWTEVAERVLPRQGDFNTKRTGGEKLNEKIFDSTAVVALERFAAAMESVLTPRAKRWHELKAPASLQADEEVTRYLHEVTSRLFAARYSPQANFASQAHETYMGLGAFGTGGLFVDDMVGRGIRYIACALSELYITQLVHGNITPAQFLGKIAAELRGVAGDAVVHQGAQYVLENAEHYKAAIEAATRAYLEARLGAQLGDAAANIADLAVNALATTVEAAAQVVADPPSPV